MGWVGRVAFTMKSRSLLALLTGFYPNAVLCSFDLDPMTEVDDEYWENEDPELAFKQPEGKPSKIAFANCLVSLQKILAYASRTIVRRYGSVGYVSEPLTFPALCSIQSTNRSKHWVTSARNGSSAPWPSWTPP